VATAERGNSSIRRTGNPVWIGTRTQVGLETDRRIEAYETNYRKETNMKVYGLRIGDVGVEFSDRQARENALLIFTKGSSVKIHSYQGARYEAGENSFSTYERDTNENLMNCHECKGVFSSEVCSQRAVPEKDYSKGFKENETESICLCDACAVKRLKDYEVWKAQKTLETVP